MNTSPTGVAGGMERAPLSATSVWPLRGVSCVRAREGVGWPRHVVGLFGLHDVSSCMKKSAKCLGHKCLDTNW